jgi:hypothetical protein
MILTFDNKFVIYYQERMITELSYSGKHFDLMQIQINNDLQIFDQRAKTWLADFNPKKTKALIISNNTSGHN